MPPRERNPSVGERIADFFGWQSTAPAEENGTINEDSREDVESQSQLTSNQKINLQPAQEVTVGNDITPTAQTQTSSYSITPGMPFKLRQQLGLTPKTNMRLFKCDSQPMKKSVLSNASIAPCSEESFVFSQTRPFDQAET